MGVGALLCLLLQESLDVSGGGRLLIPFLGDSSPLQGLMMVILVMGARAFQGHVLCHELHVY